MSDMNEVILKKLQESRRRNLKEVFSNWDAKDYPNSYELDIYLRKLGYTLNRVHKNDGKVVKLQIDSVKDNYTTPKIYWVEDHLEVQTASYGTLEVSDLEEVIKGYQKAIEVIKHIESLNIDNLES